MHGEIRHLGSRIKAARPDVMSDSSKGASVPIYESGTHHNLSSTVEATPLP